MDPVETYITELRQIQSTGSAVDETSYYGPLATLLNEIGNTLKPKVKCVINIRNRGAGLPDGGFFTPDQMRLAEDALFTLGPSRGAMEVKGPGEDVRQVARSEQVRGYASEYGLVLVTNYRDFLLVAREPDGRLRELESYTLTATADEFWREVAHPRRMAERHTERLTQYLMRVLLHEAPLVQPKDVAWFLASYARDAKARIDSAEDLAALDAVRGALEEALGLTFEGEKGERFFRSTLVQTLFYGLFSAWVLWNKQGRPGNGGRFNWRMAEWSLHVPMIRALYEQISTPSQLGRLGLEEVMSWAGEALNRVLNDEFFARFEESQAVQYFYEPFLEAFDPELRKSLGVWYTPPEIVKYMVARVDTVLREDLGIRDGLADPNVYVLDPCCGTGAYLVEVLRRMEQTMRDERGDSALIARSVKRAAMERVFGFEILPAPFVVAHLQLGLLLGNLGAPLSDEQNERAGVYLTNALTGWEPPTGPQGKLPYPEMEEERDAADAAKRDRPILVVIGNPPYNAFAGVSPKEEQGLVEVYKEGLISKWGIRKFNLDDLYVRFFRLAERRIAEMTGRGVVCYISNFSYLGDPSFVVMRQRFLEEFDSLWFDCMNGDSRETGKLTPDGKPDPSVFSTEFSREGIRVGTAVALMVRKRERAARPVVRFRQFWGLTKREDLVASLAARRFDAQYERPVPRERNRFSFRPLAVAASYLRWPRLTDLCAYGPYQGLAEDRRKALIDIDTSRLEARMRTYCDPSVSWTELAAQGAPLTHNYVDFPAEAVRTAFLATQTSDAASIRRFFMRPFDTQHCYFTSFRPIWRRHRPEFHTQSWQGNAFIASRFKCAREPEGVPFGYVTGLCDYHYLPPNVGAIPLRIRTANTRRNDRNRHGEGNHCFPGMENAAEPTAKANLSQPARAYLAHLGVPNPDSDAHSAGVVWMHALAIGYSPAYLTENADGIRQDWPRIPLPDSKEALLASAALGEQIAALLNTEEEIEGVTCGAVTPELREIAVIRLLDAGQVSDPDDLAITAGWGHPGKDGVTMPGKGKLVERSRRSDDGLGERALDVYLNDKAYWRGIPKRVWDYHIGGYQVIKKWLSYRERDLLGRSLTDAEADYVTKMAQRIAAIILLEPDLDANYQRAKSSCYTWPSI